MIQGISEMTERALMRGFFVQDIDRCRVHLISRNPMCNLPRVNSEISLCEAHRYALAGNPQSTEPPEPIKTCRPTEGTIYAVQNGYNIKVGWTGNLPQRMLNYPPSSVLLVAYPGTRKDETGIHRSMAHLTTHGREWLPVAPQVTEWVARMVALHGTPEQPTFGAKRTAPRQPTAKQPMRVKAYRG